MEGPRALDAPHVAVVDSGRRPGVRWLWSVFGAIALLGTTVLGLVAVAFAGRQPEVVEWLSPTAPLTAAAVLLAWAATLLTFAWPRRRQSRAFVLLGVGGSAVLAAALGLVSTAPCVGDEDWLLTPVWETLILFVGTSPPAFADGGACAGGVPLSVQLARTCAVMAVFGTAVAAGLALASGQAQRMRARFMTFDEVVVAADEASLSLVDGLSRAGGARPRRVLVIVAAGEERVAALARGMGAFAVVLPTLYSSADDGSVRPSKEALQGMLVRGRRSRAPRVWVLEPDIVKAVAIKQVVDELQLALGSAPMRQQVRCDDHDLATQLKATWNCSKETFADALCKYDVTAVELIGRIARPSPGRGRYAVVICGDSSLADSLVIEELRRVWEWRQLRAKWTSAAGREGADPPDHDPRDLLTSGDMPALTRVVSPGADRMLAHARRSVPAMIREAVDDVDISAVPIAWAEVEAGSLALPPDVTDIELVITTRVATGELHHVARLRSELETVHRVRTWTQDEALDSMDSVGSLGARETYSLDVLLHGRAPEDAWDRMGRMIHELYRREWFGPGPMRRPWWHEDQSRRLAPEWREDNVDQARTFVRNVAELGYDWVRALDVTAPWAPSTDELETLASEEHSRWCRTRRDLGWEYAPIRDDAGSKHPQLLPWVAAEDGAPVLDDDGRARCYESVRSLARTMAAIGYRPVPRTGS